jgi:hypothetical protein
VNVHRVVTPLGGVHLEVVVRAVRVRQAVEDLAAGFQQRR